jgi:Outer membrane protein
MKKLILFSLILFCGTSISAQLTIEECYSKARANYPLIRQYDLIEKSKDYNLSNAGKGYLPQIIFSAKATYQSDVTQLPIDFAQLGMPNVNIPSLSKDQYGANLDVNQIIWDGGAIKSKKEGIRTSSETEKKSLEVDLYAINERVNQVFFGILLFEAQIEQINLFREELQQNYNKITSRIENGIANQADLDAIKVEQLKALQTKSQLTHTRKAYLDILSALIGEKLNSETILQKPKDLSSLNTSIQRPELDLFNARIKNLEAQNKEIDAGLMPRLGVFITGGYGKPGLNMLENEFSAYYIAGVNLSWNFSNLYSNKNNKRKIENSIAFVQTQQETFLFNSNLDMTNRQSEINKYRDQLKYDDEIIALRNSIKQSSETKMANGTLSGIDLMRDINAEEQARQDKILHEIEMLLAIYNLKFVTN